MQPKLQNSNARVPLGSYRRLGSLQATLLVATSISQIWNQRFDSFLGTSKRGSRCVARVGTDFTLEENLKSSKGSGMNIMWKRLFAVCQSLYVIVLLLVTSYLAKDYISQSSDSQPLDGGDLEWVSSINCE